MKWVISKIIAGIFYLVLYAFFTFVFKWPQEVLVGIIVLSFLILQTKLEKFLKSAYDYILPGKYKKIIQAFNQFEDRINEVSKYHELIREFYYLFNIIFPDKSWLFYVSEETSFRMIKYDTSKADENCPKK